MFLESIVANVARAGLFSCLMLAPSLSFTAEFRYWKYFGKSIVLSDEEAWCEYLYSADHWASMIGYYDSSKSKYTMQGSDPLLNQYDPPILTYNCGNKYSSYPFGTVYYVSISCSAGEVLDRTLGVCSVPGQKGRPDEPWLCSNPSSVVGNPINITTGNKFEERVVLKLGIVDPIVVSRYYNSFDGVWVHGYSAHLVFGEGVVVLVGSDGKQSMYTAFNDKYVSATNIGTLDYDGLQWVYVDSSNKKMYFSQSGRLSKTVESDGAEQVLSYESLRADRKITVRNRSGLTVELLESSTAQLRSVKSSNQTVVFKYYPESHTETEVKVIGGREYVRRYHYEDPRNDALLTGITDERGVRYATWAYDALNRAISSQHGDGASRVTIDYGADGANVVAGELGSRAVYRFQTVSGLRRIKTIDSEPTPDCPASNSSYTYNERGQVLTKTDAKGLITTYDYNGRGLETSRTEASGTTLARTVTTEWDPERFLPIRVTEPDRITTYSYDTQGRELSRQTTSR
ncbi:DUF6531 domain-containing protein [Pseudomonas alliivorans]|nr:DUF6531 domain-containing protein [Pseudomonas alliivorans]